MGYLPGLDGIRALAVLGVLLYHGDLTWMRGGFLGVDVFFVLSGFVIAASYGDRLAQGFPRGRFMLLRLGRVVPLHMVAVLLLRPLLK